MKYFVIWINSEFFKLVDRFGVESYVSVAIPVKKRVKKNNMLRSRTEVKTQNLSLRDVICVRN